MKASNRRKKASDGRMKASDGRMKASNRRKKASDGSIFSSVASDHVSICKRSFVTTGEIRRPQHQRHQLFSHIYPYDGRFRQCSPAELSSSHERRCGWCVPTFPETVVFAARRLIESASSMIPRMNEGVSTWGSRQPSRPTANGTLSASGRHPPTGFGPTLRARSRRAESTRRGATAVELHSSSMPTTRTSIGPITFRATSRSRRSEPLSFLR